MLNLQGGCGGTNQKRERAPDNHPEDGADGDLSILHDEGHELMRLHFDRWYAPRRRAPCEHCNGSDEKNDEQTIGDASDGQKCADR
jgi:hypothetical protein